MTRHTSYMVDSRISDNIRENQRSNEHQLFTSLINMLIAAILSCGLFPRTSLCQPESERIDGKLTYRVPRVDSPVMVDGVLDEEAWATAVRIDANIEVRPGENVPAPVETEALIAYSREYLYVAMMAYDPDPSQIRAHLSNRGDINNNDDWILLLVDTFNGQRLSYDFMCNPLGVQDDFIESTNGGGDWDVIWESEGRITNEGYIVEMAIPFSSLQFPGGGGEQVWGFDIVRSYPRSVRHHIGSFPRDRNNNNYFSQLIKLVGFEGVVPGKNIELDPTLSAGFSQEREDETSGPFIEKNRSFEPGITGRWSITPNMTLSATVNPDFSQVEADAAQMDINTRFPLQYSEKRPFFLEGVDIFSTQFNFVHTRTLAEPDWGVKLTGKADRHSIGFFAVRDNITPLVFPACDDAENTTLSMQSTGSVFRYKYDVGEDSDVGITLTDREGSDYYNRLASVDGTIRFTDNDQIEFQAAGSTTDYPDQTAVEFDQSASDFAGHAYRLGYFRNTENYHFRGVHYAFNPDFRADLGFETQTDFQFTEIAGQYRWRRDADHWFTQLSVFSAYRLSRDYSGDPRLEVFVNDIYYEGPMQSSIELFYRITGTQWYHGKKYDVGKYFFLEGALKPSGSTNLGLVLLNTDQIDFDNEQPGERISVRPRITQTLGRHVSLNLEHNFQRLNVDAGRLFDANVSNFRIAYQFNKRAFLRLNLQNVHYDRNLANYCDEKRDDFDASTHRIFSQILFSYTINPQTVFFLGYSDNYRNRTCTDDDGYVDESLIQTNRAIFTKIGYAFLL